MHHILNHLAFPSSSARIKSNLPDSSLNPRMEVFFWLFPINSMELSRLRAFAALLVPGLRLARPYSGLGQSNCAETDQVREL